MRLSGANIKGYKYVGQPTLGTIGQQIFWYDYRFNYDTFLVGADTKIFNWRSLAVSGTPLNGGTNKLYFYSDGFGYVNGGLASANQGLAFTELNQFHKGTDGWMWAGVVKGDYTSATTTSSSLIINTLGSSGPGFLVRLTNYGSNPFIRFQIFNDAGTQVITNSTTANSFPLSRFVPVVVIFYGDAAASNYKVIIEGTSYSFSNTPTYGTAAAQFIRLGLAVLTVNDYRNKMQVAYNLAGKSRAQIDAFVTNFYTTLKADSEYSALTTP
jgi:hypothetical protein